MKGFAGAPTRPGVFDLQIEGEGGAAKMAAPKGAAANGAAEIGPVVVAVDTPEADANPLPRIRKGDWLQNAAVSLPPEVIRGVLHQGCKMVIGGASKARKTWSLIDMGLSVAAGVTWWGLQCDPGPVLYLNFEVPESFFVHRVRRVAKAKGIPIPSTFASMALRGWSGGGKDLLARIAQTVKESRPVLIIIDPVYKLALDVEENSAKDILKLCNCLETLAEQSGAAVVVAAHFSKGNQSGKDSIDRISGSGVWARDSDTLLIATQHEKVDCLSVELTLRNHPQMKPFVVEWQEPLMVRRDDMDASNLKKLHSARGGSKSAGASVTADEVFKLLPMDRHMPVTAWHKLAEELTGVGRTKFFQLWKQIQQKMAGAFDHNPNAGVKRLV